MFHQETKILIVDDMATMRQTLRSSLHSLGFESILEANDGEMAWRLIEKAESDQAPFQLIISDWNAPTLNGLALLKQVRGMDNADAHLPFILITSESHKEQVMEAIQAGVSSFIVKPFTVQMLQQKLSAVHANMLKARAAAAAQAQAQAAQTQK